MHLYIIITYQCFRLITVLCYATKRISWIEIETIHNAHTYTCMFEVRCDQRFCIKKWSMHWVFNVWISTELSRSFFQYSNKLLSTKFDWIMIHVTIISKDRSRSGFTWTLLVTCSGLIQSILTWLTCIYVKREFSDQVKSNLQPVTHT